jgi:2-polyprenyl-3-methyl-5-hydroxy-6-metoxy-1,4-benzoquinol methylase
LIEGDETNLVDRLLRRVVRTIGPIGATEAQYWESFWEDSLRRFDRDGMPFEEMDPWERGCNYEMAAMYERLFGGLEGCSVVELGCGGGHISGLMAAKALHVTLVDYSSAAIEYARRTAVWLGVESKVTLVQGDVGEVELPEHDYCFNCGVVEHYTNAEIEKMLRIMAAVGRRGSAVTVPNLLSPELAYRMARYGKGSERYLTPTSLRARIEHAGLNPVRLDVVNHWTPSFLGAGVAGAARRLGLTDLFWRLGWLFTWSFERRTSLDSR